MFISREHKKICEKKHCEYEEHKSYVNQAFYFLGETHITKKRTFSAQLMDYFTSCLKSHINLNYLNSYIKDLNPNIHFK